MKEIGRDDTVIVELLAEGGSLTLYGRRQAAGQWEFRREVSWTLGYDDDTPTVETGSRQPTLFETESGTPRYHWVGTWEDALTLLDRYPWATLHPKRVHREFRDRVYEAVVARWPRAHARRTWSRVLGRPLVQPPSQR